VPLLSCKGLVYLLPNKEERKKERAGSTVVFESESKDKGGCLIRGAEVES